MRCARRPTTAKRTTGEATSWRGKRALITGGDSGIGRAVTIAVAREGADVAISYYDEHEDAKYTVEWIEKAGRRALSLDGDLQDPDHCRHIVERTVEEFGGLNILVNHAAYHLETSEFLEITPEQLDRLALPAGERAGQPERTHGTRHGTSSLGVADLPDVDGHRSSLLLR